jgi:hypothetical protein
MTLSEPIQILQLITSVFEQLDIPYFISGSLASSLHGIPRATQDIDLVADLKSNRIIPFIKALETTFYIDADMIQEAIQRRSSFNMIHLATMFKADIFIFPNDPVSILEMKRREAHQLTGEKKDVFFVLSAEDVVLRKLLWFKIGGEVAEKQWQDILGVLEVQKTKLDTAYLERNAQQMQVIALLKRAFHEAGIEEESL